MSKDYFGYTGKKVVVTGAASGMGKATTEFLVELGAEVYAMDFNEATTPGIKKFIQVNLGEKDSIDAAFKELPDSFDSFFGVAGVSGMSHDAFTTLVIDFLANKYITQEYLSKRIVDNGSIAYVSSVGGSKWFMHKSEYLDIVEAEGWDATYEAIVAKPLAMGIMGYVIAKRALTYFAKWSVLELGKRGIRVNVTAPGLSDTGLHVDFQTLSGGKDAAAQKMYGIHDRSATSEEQANALVFLNSDLASYISGQELFVDDGREALIQTHDWLDNNIAPMLPK